MTFAVLRALHNIIGEALDDIEQVYHAHGQDAVAGNAEASYGDSDSEPTATTRSSLQAATCSPLKESRKSHRTSGHKSTLSIGSVNTVSKAYVSPPPSPCVASYNQTFSSMARTEPLDFPSLDSPCDPTCQSEILTSHPKVMAAINRIISACGQMTATVQAPFLTICDSTMGYHLPSCMRIVEAGNIVEVLRESGVEGLHIGVLSERSGIEASKLAHILRLLATHHIFREISPDVFALNRISSLMDSGRTTQELSEYQTTGRPELKYQGTNGIAAFVGLCSDEINKSSAYMTETYLLSTSPKVRGATEPTLTPFCFAFGTARRGIDYFGWLEGEGASSIEHHFDPGAEMGIGSVYSPALGITESFSDAHGNADLQSPGSTSELLPVENPNRFRLERFGKAMSGTGSWEAPGAVFNGFDWESLPPDSIVVDVGGGIGSTSMLLASAFSSPEGENRGLKFIIQDRSVVVEMGEKAWMDKCPELLNSGIAVFQVHDFFTPQPIRNASVFLLRVVLHDWPDDYARKILLHLREAATSDTKLLLADFVLPLACAETMSTDSGLEGIEGAQGVSAPAPLLANFGKASANVYWMDLTMNVMFNSQERTLREIVSLALSAGWKVVRVTHAPGSLFGHIVAVPVPVPTPRQGSRSLRNSVSPSKSASPSLTPLEETKKRLGISQDGENSSPEVDLSRRASVRCNTPTFGSRMELSSVKEALTRFGGGVKRYRGPGVLGRALASSPSTSKKTPSPLTILPSLYTSPSGLNITIASPLQEKASKSIKRHASLANINCSSLDLGPAPPIPTLPQLPTPLSPRSGFMDSFKNKLEGGSGSLSSALAPSHILRSPIRDSDSTTGPSHRRSDSTSSSMPTAKTVTRRASSAQLNQPQLPMGPLGSPLSMTVGRRVGGNSRLPRPNVLRFPGVDIDAQVEEAPSTVGNSPARTRKMSSVLAVAARIERGLSLRRPPPS
ncbi:hypothetical protein FA15DRAFT_694701 [Coprinopsis marcescibilis]|uniref:O-methyltransferase C-terminal domain-containing protein n=1 Tax=Coprinopsis marcescibilis TaxID=230819 RepID=A0A5C3KTW5_COPMA|nr:hypothetical protein FA15DRAFT_694701 [Coprinopsis marcescibilis]